jgi:hypothetical protein
MYGDFLNAFGLAFTLFVVIMFAGYLFKSGSIGIFKFLMSRSLVILFISTVCAITGILIYSLVTSSHPLDVVHQLMNLIKDEAGKI